MQRISCFLIGLLGIISIDLQGQIGGLTLETPWSELARKVAREGIYLIRLEYVLENVESEEQFGRNGKAYFNRVYLPAVSVEGFIWANKDFITRPWHGDEPFQPYVDSEDLRPVITSISIRDLKSGPYHNLLEMSWADSLRVADLEIGAFKADSLIIKPFEAAPTEIKPDAKLAIYLKKPMGFEQNDTLEIPLAIDWSEVNFEERASLVKVNTTPKRQDKLFGGVLFSPTISNASIRFDVVSILENFGNTWMGIRIQRKADYRARLNEELTPVNSSKSNEKTDSDQNQSKGSEKTGRGRRKKRGKNEN